MRTGMSTGKLIGLMALFVAVGTPLVWYLWSTANEVLGGQFDGARVLWAVPVLFAFLLLLFLLMKAVRGWDAPRP